MNRKNLLLVSLLILWTASAIVFSFYDLEISKTLVDKNSGWAIFLENYGMLPGLIVILFGIFAHYSIQKTNSSKTAAAKKIVLFLAASGIFLYIINIIMINALGDDEFFNTYLIALIFISAIVSIVILKLFKPAGKEITSLLLNYSTVVILTAFWGYVILIQIVKFFWGRMRFRDLDPTFSEFTSWFLPQGVTGNDSFPSGHAAMGWMLLPLMILVINKNKRVKFLVFFLICCWAIAVLLSRIVVGAHYASDVLFGSFFIIITFLLFYRHTIK